MNKRRVFLGFSLNDALKKGIREFREKNRHISTLRWYNEGDLHLTLLFIGNVNDEQLAEIITKTEAWAAKRSSLRIHLERLCLAPPAGKPSMLWASFKEDALFSHMHFELGALLKMGDLSRERVIPHITLARFKYLEANTVFHFDQHFDSREWNLDKIHLYESKITSRSGKYEVLKSFDLQGSQLEAQSSLK